MKIKAKRIFWSLKNWKSKCHFYGSSITGYIKYCWENKGGNVECQSCITIRWPSLRVKAWSMRNRRPTRPSRHPFQEVPRRNRDRWALSLGELVCNHWHWLELLNHGVDKRKTILSQFFIVCIFLQYRTSLPVPRVNHWHQFFLWLLLTPRKQNEYWEIIIANNLYCMLTKCLEL